MSVATRSVEPITTEPGQVVQVYYNLHRHCFSIRDKRTRRVIGHSRHVVMHNCKLKVSESGRQRVLHERKKNVHAFVEGELLTTIPFDTVGDSLTELTYNPYKYASFVIKEDNTPVFGADYVVFNTKRIWGKGLR